MLCGTRLSETLANAEEYYARAEEDKRGEIKG